MFSEIPFYNIKGVAYRERDHALITNVFFYYKYYANFYNPVSSTALREYFQRYGIVNHVTLRGEPLMKKDINGYYTAYFVGVIYFGEAEAAAAILQQGIHSFEINEGVPIVVHTRVAHNQGAYTEQVPCYMIMPQISNTTLTDLHSDDLWCIFKLLKIRDQVNLARSCQYMSNAYVEIYGKEYETFDLTKFSCLNEKEIFGLLQSVGAAIKLIKGESDWIDNTRHYYKIFEIISRCCLRIEKTYFSHLPLYVPINDKIIQKLSQIKSLKALSFPVNEHLSGKPFTGFTNLEELKIVGDINHDYMFFRMFPTMKSLKILDVIHYKWSTQFFYMAIAGCCKGLEKLKIRLCGDSYIQVPALLAPKLKQLTIHVATDSGTQFLDYLCYAKNLEVIKMTLPNLNGYLLLLVIRNCSKLVSLTLNISHRIWDLDEETLRKIVEIHHGKSPLTIYVRTWIAHINYTLFHNAEDKYEYKKEYTYIRNENM